MTDHGDNQLRLGPDDLHRFAEGLDLDRGTIKAHPAGDATRPWILRDAESGEASPVDGMPSLLIGGRRYEGPRDADGLAAALGAATQERSR